MAQKKLPSSTDGRRQLLEPRHRYLSLRRQGELVGLAQSSWYYEPARETGEKRNSAAHMVRSRGDFQRVTITPSADLALRVNLISMTVAHLLLLIAIAAS